jgi:hypothetical protein
MLLVLWATACSDTGEPPSRADRRATPTPTSVRTFGPAETTGRIEEPELTETSGIVAASSHRNTFWAHNDSDAAPSIYCFKLSGRSCGTVALEGVTNVDWEAIGAGGGSLFVADIGDNLRARDSVVIYRIEEPEPPGNGAGSTAGARAIEFTYPEGKAHNAEAFFVHPNGRDAYILTKEPAGKVFKGSIGGGELRRIARLGLPGFLSVPTAADVSSDGKHVIVGTYGDAFELSLATDRPFDSIWSAEPRAVEFPIAGQREAIAYGGDSIVTTSEGQGAAIIVRELVP